VTQSPREYRKGRATELRRMGLSLLETARHHDLQAFLRRALAEIDDAHAWLLEHDVDARPAILTIIDMDLAFAEYRLNAAKCTLRFQGADAPRIG
jgi:hypothetical protein